MKNLEGSMDHLLESQQKKIKGLESQLTAAIKQKTTYQQQVETLELQVSRRNQSHALWEHDA